MLLSMGCNQFHFIASQMAYDVNWSWRWGWPKNKDSHKIERKTGKREKKIKEQGFKSGFHSAVKVGKKKTQRFFFVFFFFQKCS